MTRPLHSFAAVWLASLGILLGVLPGCNGSKPPSQSSNVLDEVAPTRSKLDQSLDLTERLYEAERRQGIEVILSLLNGYLGEHKPVADWRPDEMVERLPKQYRTLPPVQDLGQLSFQPTDVLFLEEAMLLGSISQRVAEQPLPKDLQSWLDEQESKLGRDQAKQLALACRMFDWIVRNIQLDPLPAVPQEAIGTAGGQNAAEPVLPLPLQGVIGPGYGAFPWYVLMQGHGDAWQRARIFTLLARQQGLDVVMLGLSKSADDAPRPWASGVLIGEQLYLFDPALGLPIPVAQDRGVATLADIRAKPELLRALDVDAAHPYAIATADIKNVTALIDASLESLSRRMALLEAELPASRKLRLTIKPSELAQRLRKLPGISQVALWNVPIEATFFEFALASSPRMDPNLRGMIREERTMLEQPSLMSIARHRQLRGQFENTDDRRGAKAMFVEARVPDAEIDALETNRELLDSLGMTQYLARLTPEQAAAAMASIKARVRRGKIDCGYWLGLTHCETGNYQAAINWLDQRTLKLKPPSFWAAGARYNLARAYEQLDAPKLAQDLYIDDDSPQQHGNLLRAKRLSPQKPAEN